MITDSTLRRLAYTADGALVCYNRRWRRRHQVDIPANAFIVEGKHAVLVVVDNVDEVRVEVRLASDLAAVAASGVYRNWNWTFDGPSEAFADVPEYLVLKRESGNAFLRIADGAVLQLLDAAQGLDTMTSVAAVPESRLVVLSNGKQWCVYDPQTTQAGYHSKVVDFGPLSAMAFTPDGAQMFICDRSSLLRVDTTSWTVEDAAGMESDSGEVSPITAWSFDESGRLAVAHANGETFVVDATTMEPLSKVRFGSNATDVLILGKLVYGVVADNALESRRLD